MAERKVHDIGWATLWRVLAVAVFAAAIYFAKEAVIALLFAIVVSSALDGPVVRLNEKFKIPRLLAAALIFSLAFVLIGLLIYIVLPIAVIELTSLANQFTGTTAGTFLNSFSSVADIVTNEFSIVTLGQISDIIFRGTLPVAQTIGNIVGGIAFGVSVLIISFYLTLTQDGVGRFLKAVLPDSVEDSVLKVYYRSKTKIGRWFQAQLLLSLVVGLLVSGGLWILGVRYALVIGLLAAVLEIMPVVGPIFSGAVGTLIALSTSLSLGLYTLLLFVFIQQIENNLLVPLFMKRAVDIHPVVALFSIMAGLQLLGVAGMIISVPLAVVVQDVIEERVEKKKAMREKA
ncbi:MAG: AI-2E family transporter [Candidatus Colwellbacteria bacterium]|jgi:predicted PurR-regulated permease PerM|nr:AI-2E family transporter [Candidatus Colwellbacteria bacterium]MCK9497616.1 AI-2E family transporter [Candidatus Colwellbacteria bacterium]MDD3752494.1 AI-2E family transporter [Candidatus Colwellbacteria bacterium]MDD4818895.1 AI-2E family transporter [Candidatus Colwellbacteria bacterium]